MDNANKKRQCIKEKVKIILRQLCFLILIYCFAFTGQTYLYVKFLKEPFNLKKVRNDAICFTVLSIVAHILVRPLENPSGKKSEYDDPEGKLDTLQEMYM